MANQSNLVDTFSILDSFYHDLPDRHLELFTQPLSSFLLMELPLEIRLMVWRLTIARQRKIWLHPQKQKHGKARSSLHLSILPATQVCLESREEIYKYLKVNPKSYLTNPICITRFDIIRCDFNLLLRVDDRYEEFLEMVLRRPELLVQVRKMELMMDDYGHIDELLLVLSASSVFRPFESLEKLRLLVPAGVDWKESCKIEFEKVFSEVMDGKFGNNHPVLVVEEV